MIGALRSSFLHLSSSLCLFQKRTPEGLGAGCPEIPQGLQPGALRLFHSKPREIEFCSLLAHGRSINAAVTVMDRLQAVVTSNLGAPRFDPSSPSVTCWRVVASPGPHLRESWPLRSFETGPNYGIPCLGAVFPPALSGIHFFQLNFPGPGGELQLLWEQ